ncbi:MAG: hypothetical protein KF873_15410 [Gemmataceae bacterium]|nr:hypothetical protein [Planctomycetia bacterium]MBX3400118.1 hypothetical protein [Gemmataceae bacterium]
MSHPRGVSRAISSAWSGHCAVSSARELEHSDDVRTLPTLVLNFGVVSIESMLA